MRRRGEKRGEVRYLCKPLHGLHDCLNEVVEFPLVLSSVLQMNPIHLKYLCWNHELKKKTKAKQEKIFKKNRRKERKEGRKILC